MSDIQAIIELIEQGHRNNDHGDGRRQISEAVAMLRKMQEDSHLHSGQRWELSQILECGPLCKDIEKAVIGMKDTQRERWLAMDSAPKDGAEVFLCSNEEPFPAASLCKDGYAEGFYQGIDDDGTGDIWLVYDKRPDGDFFIVKPTHWMHKVARPPFNTNHLAEPE